ncbi:MAG: DinB family protein [Terriglobia bacterium]
MDVKELFLIQKASEHEGTIGVYAKIPRDRLNWRPAQGMLTLGQVARHAWQSEEGTRKIALQSDWSYYAIRVPKGLLAVLGEVTSLDEELQEIERVYEDTMRAVQAFPLDRWEEIRENAQFHTRRAVGVMLFRIIEHQTHHRAQVGTYLHILTGGRASPYAD